MNTQKENVNQSKRVYSKPELKSIRIDNQISMVMMSEPPVEGVNMQHSNTVDPYKISKA
jgi:hypothetical protein